MQLIEKFVSIFVGIILGMVRGYDRLVGYASLQRQHPPLPFLLPPPYIAPTPFRGGVGRYSKRGGERKGEGTLRLEPPNTSFEACKPTVWSLHSPLCSPLQMKSYCKSEPVSVNDVFRKKYLMPAPVLFDFRGHRRPDALIAFEEHLGRAKGQVEVEADRNMVGIVSDIEPDKIQGITKISSLKMSIRPMMQR